MNLNSQLAGLISTETAKSDYLCLGGRPFLIFEFPVPIEGQSGELVRSFGERRLCCWAREAHLARNHIWSPFNYFRSPNKKSGETPAKSGLSLFHTEPFIYPLTRAYFVSIAWHFEQTILRPTYRFSRFRWKRARTTKSEKNHQGSLSLNHSVSFGSMASLRAFRPLFFHFMLEEPLFPWKTTQSSFTLERGTIRHDGCTSVKRGTSCTFLRITTWYHVRWWRYLLAPLGLKCDQRIVKALYRKCCRFQIYLVLGVCQPP